MLREDSESAHLILLLLHAGGRRWAPEWAARSQRARARFLLRWRYARVAGAAVSSLVTTFIAHLRKHASRLYKVVFFRVAADVYAPLTHKKNNIHIRSPR